MRAGRGNESGDIWMKLEGVTAFKIRPCPASMEIMDPAPSTGRKNCGRVCGQWRGNLLRASSLHAEDCKLFTGLDNGVHQSHQSRVRHLQHVTEGEFVSRNLPQIYLSQIPTSAFTLGRRKTGMKGNCYAYSFARIWSTAHLHSVLKGLVDSTPTFL